MAQVWPASLQEKLSEANFGLGIGDTTIRTDMDVGPAKVRRRFTKSIDSYTASIYLTSAQYATFYNFFDTTLNGGVLSFDFAHPITGVTTEFRFKGTPKIISLGGGQFQASFEWEVVP
jgi:hypothetical protein